MRTYIWFLASVLFIITVCAHKAPPLFKDRVHPKLTRIKALSNCQVLLSFSEDIDTLSLDERSIIVYSHSDTLEIVALYPSLSAAEIMCLTDTQFPVKYQVTGAVYDTAQNKGIITSSFEGSTKPDTVAPYIAKYSQGANTHEFILRFSEAMDTSGITYHIIPAFTTLCEWLNLRTCRIAPQDPNDIFAPDSTYYLFINRSAYDVSGNPLVQFITSITPDTAYKPFLLKSEVRANDTLARDGIAVLKRSEPKGIAFIRNGQVTFEVRDQEAYTIEALCNGYYGSNVVWFDSINIITVWPNGKTIDSIIP